MIMEKEEYINWLIGELGYPRKGAEILFEQYIQADSTIQKALEDYKESKKIPEIKVEGYSVQILQEEQHMNIIASLFTLDYLIKDPQKAIRSLKKGHDSVIINRP